MKVSEAIVTALKNEGVETVFTVPGEHTLPLLRAARGELRVINGKLELSAAFTALGYARLRRDVGVLFTLSGPGLIASLSPITEALVEGDAMVVIATVPPWKEGSGDYMHKLLNKEDQTAAARPLTKAQYLMEDPKGIYSVMAEAFRVARSGKPGPVYIETPVSMLDAEAAVSGRYVSAGTSKEEPSDKVIEDVYRTLVNSKKPSIIAGRGVFLSRAEEDVIKLAESIQAPIMTTIMGKGIVPPDHVLYGGVAAGSAGNKISREILSKSDVVLAIGNRFSEMGTGRFTLNVPEKLIHVNVSERDMGARYKPFLGVRSDAKIFLQKLNSKLESHAPKHSEWDLDWVKTAWKEESERQLTKYEEADRAKVIEPWLVIREIERTISKDGIIVGDVGAHRIESFLIRTHRSGSYLTTTSYVSMGLAIPSAVAACVAFPGRDVVAIVGDGAFEMTGFEILTAVQYGLSPKIVVFNDSSYKILKVYEKRNYGSISPDISTLPRGDFARMAEAMGAVGIKVSEREDLRRAFSKAFAEKKRPVVLDVSVDPEAIPLPFQDLYGAARIEDITKRTN